MGSFKSKRLFVFSNLWLGPLPAPSGWHFRFSLTLTRPQKQLSIPKKKGKHSQALWYTVTSDLSDGALPMIQLELLSFLVYRPLWLPRWGHRWGLVATWPWNLTGFIICRLSLFSLLCKSSFCKKPFRLSSPAGNLNDTQTQLLVCLLRGDKIDFIDPTQAKEKPIALNMQGRRQRSGLYNVMEKFLWVFWFLSSVFFFFSYFPPWRLVTIGIHFNRMSSSCCSLAVRKTNEQLPFRADRRWECEHVHRPITAPELQGAAHPPSASEETVCCR